MNEFNKAKDEVERELTKPEVTVQPAPGQQPRQLAELPPAPQPVAAAPVAQDPVRRTNGFSMRAMPSRARCGDPGDTSGAGYASGRARVIAG